MIMNKLQLCVAIFLVLHLDAVASMPKQQTQCTTEEFRPKFHFSPAQHWINDPNGLIYYDGVYHMLYQYHPNSTIWGPMHWGHAISTNLITWEELDIALAPDQLGDIFSGSSVVDSTNTTGLKTDNGNDPIVAIYTSASGDNFLTQVQSLAYSLDKGASFQKYENNPVLKDENSPNFRDPKVFYHGGKWIMSLAVGNKIEFYGSPDLKNWTKLSEFGADPLVGNHDGVWECPDLIPLVVDVSGNGTSIVELWVLLVSINPGGPNTGSATQYFVGNFDGTTFTTYPWSDSQWMDWGPDNYAGVTFSNEPSGRALVISWMSNWNYANATPSTAWRGQMTIPRTLDLIVLNRTADQYRLVSTPAEELVVLRNPLQYLAYNAELNVLPQSVINLTEQAAFSNPLMELEITLEISKNPEPSFAICASNSKGEEVCFGYNNTEYYLDRSKTNNTAFNQHYTGALRSKAVRQITDETITVRMFLDASSIEVFADGGLTTMTAIHFPSEPLDKLYINHWSKAGSPATLKVKEYKVYGLHCWFAEKEIPATTEALNSGASQNQYKSKNFKVWFIFCRQILQQ
nr:putative GH32 family protein [Orchesella cincta]